MTSRVCLDLLGSARVRRERYVGVWLPEPLPDRTDWDQAGGADPTGLADPADQIVLDESVAMAFLVVLESMTPAERVAFVLHDVFRYPFAEIANVLGRTSAACKQLAASARRRVSVARAPVTATGQADVVRHVKEAWETKDIAALVGLLNPDAVMTADGGGMVGTVLRPVEGGARIAQYMVAIADKAPGLELLERSVNGVPGLVAQRLRRRHDRSRVRRLRRARHPDLGGPQPGEAEAVGAGGLGVLSRDVSDGRDALRGD